MIIHPETQSVTTLEVYFDDKGCSRVAQDKGSRTEGFLRRSIDAPKAHSNGIVISYFQVQRSERNIAARL
jgi:hypothetical protein